MRDEGKPLYEVAIYDIDTPVNFHSYNCLFIKQGRELETLLNEAYAELSKIKKRH